MDAIGEIDAGTNESRCRVLLKFSNVGRNNHIRQIVREKEMLKLENISYVVENDKKIIKEINLTIGTGKLIAIPDQMVGENRLWRKLFPVSLNRQRVKSFLTVKTSQNLT